jgi:hypothetical protein
VTRTTGGDESFIARLQADGTLDTSYGGITNTGGTAEPGATLVQLGAGGTPTSSVNNLAAGPDSAAYGVGTASTGVSNQTQMVLTRFGASGQLDPGFGPSGTRRLSAEDCTGSSFCGTAGGQVLVDASARVLTLSSVYDGNGEPGFAVARYASDGSLDPGFGAGGVAGPYASVALTMAFGTDNRLLLAGETQQAPLSAQLARIALEHVADPPAASTSTSTSPPGPTPITTTAGGPAPARDTTAPRLSSLRVTVARRTGRGTLTLNSSEAGRVTVAVERDRSGRRSRGRCSATARKGSRCRLYVTLRSVGATLRAGRTTIALGSARLPVGSYRAVVTATDASGNRAAPITIAFRVARATRAR